MYIDYRLINVFSNTYNIWNEIYLCIYLFTATYIVQSYSIQIKTLLNHALLTIFWIEKYFKTKIYSRIHRAT